MKYYLFVQDLTANSILVDYIEIPALKTSYGLGNLQAGHQYEWSIKAVNLFDTTLAASTSASFMRVNPEGQQIALGSPSNVRLCAGEVISIPYILSGYMTNTLRSYLTASETNFLSDGEFMQTSQAISLLARDTGENMRIRTCVEQDGLMGCSAASQIFAVGWVDSVSVVNAAGNTTSLACTGNSVQLSAHLYGNANGQPRSYYWLKNGCERIAGATDSTLTIQEAGRYQAVVTTSNGCASLSPVHSVNYSEVVKPTLETNQLNGFRCSWTDAFVKTNVVGAENTYTWHRNGTQLAAPSRPILSITEPGIYEVTVAGPGCSVSSVPIEVKASPGIALTIRTTDPSVCANQPQEAYLFAEIDQIDRRDLQYQWLKNGVPVAGASTDFISTRTPGSYTLKILTGSCAMVSNAIEINFGNPLKPIILNGATPVSATVRGCVEESLLLTTDLPPSTLVRWKEGEILDNTFSMSRKITASGTYRAVVFSGSEPGACFTESNPVEVVLGNTTDVLLEGDNVVCGWNSTMLRYTGNIGSRDFQWYKDGAPISGNTYPNFLINDPGTYSLQVRTQYPSGCTGMSSPVTISSSSNTFPRTITVAGGSERCAGLGVPLSFSPGLAGTIQWKKNGESIAGANTAYYQAFSSGVYTAEVTMNACHFVSDPIPVQIQAPVTASLSGSATITYPGTTPLRVQLTGQGPYSLAFTDGTVLTNIQASSFERVVAPGITTTYQLASVSNACGTGQTSGVAVVQVTNGAIYSVKSGSWQNPTTWSCQCIPLAENNVEIRQGHIVTLEGIEAHAQNITLSGGQLNYTQAGTIQLGN
jgi:trimeric autotransporter adhesin